MEHPSRSGKRRRGGHSFDGCWQNEWLGGCRCSDDRICDRKSDDDDWALWSQKLSGDGCRGEIVFWVIFHA